MSVVVNIVYNLGNSNTEIRIGFRPVKVAEKFHSFASIPSILRIKYCSFSSDFNNICVKYESLWASVIIGPNFHKFTTWTWRVDVGRSYYSSSKIQKRKEWFVPQGILLSIPPRSDSCRPNICFHSDTGGNTNSRMINGTVSSIGLGPNSDYANSWEPSWFRMN